MSEVTKLVLVQFAVTLEMDDSGDYPEVTDILACRGRVVGPGGDLLDDVEPANWPVFVSASETWGSVGAFGECADQVLSHATPELWDCALDVLEDPETVPPDPFDDLSDQVATLTAERDALRAESAMLSAARDADRAMLGRIIGCEQSDASMVVLLEWAEAVIAGLRADIAAVTDPDGFPLRGDS